MRKNEPGDAGLATYRILTDLSDVVAISSEWDSLLRRAPCNRAFGSSAWYISACRHDASITPYVIIARRGANLAGVLPLALGDEGKTAKFASHISDYNDIVAAQDDTAIHAGLLNEVVNGAGGYDRVIFARLRADSNCLRALEAIKAPRLVERSNREDMTCYYVRLSPSYEEYLRSRGKKFRKNLKLAQHKADRHRLVIRELEPEWFHESRIPELFLSLHLSRLGEKSYFQSPVAQAFVGELLPALFAERRMRVFALFEDEKIIGMDLLMVGANSLCAWNGGFLPEAAHWSPGKLLIAAEIRRAFETGLEEYDFLRGSHDYKATWANNCRYVSRLELGVRD